ncbi:MAG: hypothetical protein JXA25_18320 [Anaerolineales bacterium]|nr:hypothetical protein [Anaerolineales bacterium]
MFYISAIIAIVGAIAYQSFVKRVSPSINPIISILAVYLVVLALGLFLLLIFPVQGGFTKHLQELNWTQAAVGGSVLLLELGFLLMYRYGWNLSTGNLVTGIFVNIGLLAIGVLLAGEKLTPVNAVGVVLSIAGVALISYHP